MRELRESKFNADGKLVQIYFPHLDKRRPRSPCNLGLFVSQTDFIQGGRGCTPHKAATGGLYIPTNVSACRHNTHEYGKKKNSACVLLGGFVG